MGAGGPPGELAEKLREACELAVGFYPPAREVLASCTIVGLPFSLVAGREVFTYFYQVALWLEDGQLYRAGLGLPLKDLRCSHAPLILVREECLRRELPIMVAASLLHEVEHLRRYPIYTQKVLSLVREGLRREEAIARVLGGEEEAVEATLAGLANRDKLFAEAREDADLVERSVALEDLANGRVVAWDKFKFLMNLYVFHHREQFRVYECFGELRELLLLDAEMKDEEYRRMPEEGREEVLKRYEELSRAAEELEVSWLFQWSPATHP